MKLYIDTTIKDTFRIIFDEKAYDIDSRRGTSQLVIPFIVEKLNENGKTFEDVSSVEVTTEGGSFTSLRVGASIGQTISWALKVPLNGQTKLTSHPVELKYAPSSFD